MFLIIPVQYYDQYILYAFNQTECYQLAHYHLQSTHILSIDEELDADTCSLVRQSRSQNMVNEITAFYETHYVFCLVIQLNTQVFIVVLVNIIVSLPFGSEA